MRRLEEAVDAAATAVSAESPDGATDGAAAAADVGLCVQRCEECLADPRTTARPVGKDERRELKQHLTNLWAAVSRIDAAAPITGALKARAREACTRILQFTVGEHGGAKMETEVSRAWLKTGKEYHAARATADAVRCVEQAVAHAEETPDSAKRRGLLSECYVLGIEARAAAGMYTEAMDYARSVDNAARGDAASVGLWCKADNTNRLLEVFYDIAEAAHNNANHAGCAGTITFALGAPGALPAVIHSRLLMLLSHAFQMLQDNPQALAAIEKANGIHPTVLGRYLHCKCHVLDRNVDAARTLFPALFASSEFTAKMALSLSHTLAACGSAADAVDVLRGAPQQTADVRLRLFALLCQADRADDALVLLGELGRDHIQGVQTLATPQLVGLYSAAYAKAQCLSGYAALTWMRAVIDIIPPAQSGDKARACCAAANILIDQHEYADALGYINEAEGLEASAYTRALMVITHIKLDAVKEAEEDFARLATVDDPRRPQLCAWVARTAYEKGYAMLAAAAIDVVLSMPEGDPGVPPADRLQLLVNLLLCREEGGTCDAPAARDVIARAVAVFEELHASVGAEGALPSLGWWKQRADVHQAFDLAGRLCRVQGSASGELYSLLRACSVGLERGENDATTTTAAAAAAAGDVAADLHRIRVLLDEGGTLGNADARVDPTVETGVRKVYLLLAIKAKVLAHDDAAAEALLEQLLALPGVAVNDLEAVLDMVVQLGAYRSAHLVGLVTAELARVAAPADGDGGAADAASVATFARIIRRALLLAPSRDDQLHYAQLGKAAALAHPAGYPVVERQWLAAEAWNHGVHYHRLVRKAQAETWLVLAHTLAQGLPACEIRSEIDAQFDVAVDRLRVAA